MRKVLPAVVATVLPLAALATHPSIPVAAVKAKPAPTFVQPGDLKYQPDPEMGPGFSAVVLRGDPGKAGSLFTIRAKFADGYKVPPHWHPGDEGFVVLQGTFAMGLGDKWDESKLTSYPQHSYITMPKGVRHFALARGETVLELTGIGPFKTIWVNPADAPGRK